MADEILKRDENHVPVIGLVTDDVNEEIRMGRIDNASKAMKVTANFPGNTDGQIKITSYDTTFGYIGGGKLVAGSGVTLTVNNSGGNETLTISSSGIATGTPNEVLYFGEFGVPVSDSLFTRAFDTLETIIHQTSGDFTQGFDLGPFTIGSLVGVDGNVLSREVSTGSEGKASIGVFDGTGFGYDTVGAGSFVTDSTGQVALSFADTTNGIRWSYFDSSLTVGSDGGLTPVGVQFGASDASTYWNKMWLSKDAPAFIGSELPGDPTTFTRAWFTPTVANIGNPDTARLEVNVGDSAIFGNNLRAWTNPIPSFTGTGTDDIILIGSYVGDIGTEFTVEITSVNNQNVTYNGLSGGSFNIGDTISNGSGVTGTVTLDYGNGFYLTNVTGGQFANLDPLDNGLGVTATAQGTSGLYDLYDWTNTQGGSGSGATDGQTLLALGISVNFGTATGHAIGDEWTWTYSALYLTIGRMFDFDGIDKTLAIGDADNLFSGYGIFGNVDTGLFRVGSSTYDFMTLDLATPYFRLQNSTGDSLMEYQPNIGRFGLNYAGVNTFEYDGSGFQFRLGDITGTTYLSSLVYDWINQSLTLSQELGGSTRYPLRITKPGGNTLVELGDPTGGGNGSAIIIDDATETVSNFGNNGIREVQSTYNGDVTRIHLKISLTASQIKNSNSTPIDIGLPASGSGYYYRVTQFDTRLNYGTVSFTSTALQIRGGSFGSGDYQMQFTNLGAGSNNFAKGELSSSNSISANDTLVIAADSDSLVGDSTIDCYITVEKVIL